MEESESEGNGSAVGQGVDLHVGLRVPWSQALEVLGQWHSQGNRDFHVKFAQRKAEQPGEVDQAECVYISQEHGPEYHASAMQNSVVHMEVRVLRPTGEDLGVLGRAADMAACCNKRPHLDTSQVGRGKPFMQDAMDTGTRTAPMNFMTHPYSTSQPSLTCPTAAPTISLYDLRRPPNHVKTSTDDAMLYERYRGKGLGYSLRGVGIDAARPDDENGGNTLVVRPFMLPGTGQVKIYHLEERGFVESVRVAVSWAMLVEKSLAEAGFEIVHSLRSLQYDVCVDARFPWIQGCSIGVVVALNLLQSMTNCFFNDEVMATGILGLNGNVSRVAGSRTKARLAARVAGSKVLMLPRPNMTEAQQVVEEQHLKLQLRPLQTMCDAIKGAVRKPKLRASLSDVLREGASATALRRNIVSLKAVSTVGHNVYSVIVAAIPGSGQVHLTGLKPNPQRPGLKLRAAIALDAALTWVRQGGGRNEGLHQHILDLLPAGVCQGVLVDLVNMRVTARHPEASEYRPTGRPDAPIPPNSIDIHVHIRNDTYGVAMDTCFLGSTVVLALVSLVTGVDASRTVAIYGECMLDGAMHGVGHMNVASLRFIHQYYGVTTMLLSQRDADLLQKTSPEVFHPTFDGPKVKPVAWIHECIREAFQQPT